MKNCLQLSQRFRGFHTAITKYASSLGLRTTGRSLIDLADAISVTGSATSVGYSVRMLRNWRPSLKNISSSRIDGMHRRDSTEQRFPPRCVSCHCCTFRSRNFPIGSAGRLADTASMHPSLAKLAFDAQGHRSPSRGKRDYFVRKQRRVYPKANGTWSYWEPRGGADSHFGRARSRCGSLAILFVHFVFDDRIDTY
jgi:hypothetical protein